MDKISILTQIKSLIDKNKFEHFYLLENILRAFNENQEINSIWLKGDINSWILGFSSDGIYNIYGLNYGKELLDSVIKELNFKELPDNLILTGNKKLLTEILVANPTIKYEIIKNRYFYETTLENFKPFDYPELDVRQANINDINIISEHICRFFEEEYNSQNNKNFDEIKISIKAKILDGKFIVVQKKGEIVGFSSKMDTEFENEMIGMVFIDSNHRKLNYGKLVLSQMTKTILNRNLKSWLMTDITNAASNKLVESLGYHKIFEFSSGLIKKIKVE